MVQGPVWSAPPRAPSPIRICGGCGTIAPIARQGCSQCNTPFGPAPLVAAGGAHGAVWARVHESDFVCRGCGLRSPIPLDFGAEAECLRCGLRQAFPPGQWEKGLAAAHAVADLTGPDPEGRYPDPRAPVGAKNPHRSVGVEHTFLVHTEESTIIDGAGVKQLSLRVKASPGHPLCPRCRVPLDVALDGRGNAQTSCGRCGDRAVYAIPAGGDKAPRLKAVIGADHRTDRPAAKVGAVGSNGVAALTCPGCGAGLGVTPGDEMATCAYCKVTSRIARRAWGRASGEAPPFEPFWVLLEGPSPLRDAIVHGRDEDEEEDDDDDDDELDAALAGTVPALEGQYPMVAPAPPRAPAPNKLGLWITILVALITLGAAGGFALYEILSPDEAPTKPTGPVRGKQRR